ncbi:U4/U6.U5 small nuclear ribonucleoprotein 27 kDa protein [Linum grandiflorum]
MADRDRYVDRDRARDRDRDRDRDRRREKEDRDRLRDRERDRDRIRSTRSRTRSPDRDRDRRSPSHRRHRHQRTPSPSPPRKRHRHEPEEEREKDRQRSADFVDGISKRKENNGGVAAEGDGNGAEMNEDEIEMMKMLGIPTGFDSTKGKPVEGCDVSGVRAVSKRQPRQYMNRRGGFNRPLPAERNR